MIPEILSGLGAVRFQEEPFQVGEDAFVASGVYSKWIPRVDISGGSSPWRQVEGSDVTAKPQTSFLFSGPSCLGGL